MAATSSTVTASTIEDRYRAKVEAEIADQRRYARRQMRRYRVCRLAVAATALAVPVLVGVSWVPRVVLGVLGVAAAIIAEMQQLFRYQQTSQHAMKTANALERELNLYVMAAGPYAIPRPQGHTLFVERVEAIRAAEDKDFLSTWQTAAVSTADEKGAPPRPRTEADS